MSLEYRDETDVDKFEDLDEVSDAASFPLPVYTIALLIGIAAVFASQLYVGLDNEKAFAAAFNKPVFLQGSYWLILTGATVHGSVLHFVMNSYALYSFGKLVEMLSNRADLAIVFVLSALGGGILSLLYNPENSSVGASGGIVGLISYLAVYAFRRRQFISHEFRKSLLINIGFILIFGLVLYQVIDNFGHIGGFLMGALYGLFQVPRDANTDPREASGTVEILGILALGAYLAACVFGALLTLRIV